MNPYKMKATGSNLIIKQAPHERKSEGGLHLLSSQKPFSLAEVISKGPKCYGEYDVGDTLWIEGANSGIKIEDEFYLVSEVICIAKVEENG